MTSHHGILRSQRASPNGTYFFILIVFQPLRFGFKFGNGSRSVLPFLVPFPRYLLQLTNYYTMSICTPARASLMTGRYVVRYGLQYNVIQPGAPWGLPLEEKVCSPDTWSVSAVHVNWPWCFGSSLYFLRSRNA